MKNVNITRGGSARATGLTALLLTATVAIFACGCESARVAEPLTRTVGGNDPGERLEFWHSLAERPVTSNDEAFHGLLLFADGDDPAGDYPGRVKALKAKGMLSPSFDAPGDLAVDRGTLAVALARQLGVKGGLMMRLTGLAGPSPRYAVRELQFLNVYPPSSPNQTFSGAEFLGIIAKAEEYQKSPSRGSQTVDVARDKGPAEAPGAEAPPTEAPTTGAVGADAPATGEAGPASEPSTPANRPELLPQTPPSPTVTPER